MVHAKVEMRTILTFFALIVVGFCPVFAEAPGEIFVILPVQTPYDESPDAREAYLSGYGTGYQQSATGKYVIPQPFSDGVLRKAALDGLRAGYNAAVANGDQKKPVPNIVIPAKRI